MSLDTSRIQSLGVPPERHADRVIGEMLREISRVTAELLPNIRGVVANSSDGNPVAQRKLEARLKRVGAIGTILKPGKRGKYRIGFFAWSGWDPATDMIIQPGDALPLKPWLASCLHVIRRAASRCKELAGSSNCVHAHLARDDEARRRSRHGKIPRTPTCGVAAPVQRQRCCRRLPAA